MATASGHLLWKSDASSAALPRDQTLATSTVALDATVAELDPKVIA
jgi:hypothetical protein